MRYYIGRCLLAAPTSDPYQPVGSALHLSPRGRQFEADMGHIRKGCKIKDGVGCRVCCADRLIWITGVTFYSPWTYPSTTQYAPQSTRKPDVGWSGLCRVVSRCRLSGLSGLSGYSRTFVGSGLSGCRAGAQLSRCDSARSARRKFGSKPAKVEASAEG